MYTNADSLPNKKTELENMIHSMEQTPHIIAVNKVKPKRSRFKLTDAEVSLAGYDMFTTHLDDDLGRGSILYVHNALKAAPMHKDNNSLEEIWINIQLDHHDKLTVGLLYRSPGNNKEENERLNNSIKEASKLSGSHLLIMGDFNHGDINWETRTSPGDFSKTDKIPPCHLFLETIRDCFLYQHVQENTRVRGGDTPSLLDLVITNIENMVNKLEFLSPLGRSDHCIITFEIECSGKRTSSTVSRPMYDRGNYTKMKEDLSINWKQTFEHCKDDADKQFEIFCEKVKCAEKTHIPIKKITAGGIHNKTSIPLDDNIRAEIKKKHRCWTRLMESKSDEKRLKYNRQRNKVRKLTRQAKKEKELEIAKQVKSNPKIFWKYVNSKTKTRTGIGELNMPGTNDERGKPLKAKSDEDKAKILAEFFSSVFTQEKEGDIPSLDKEADIFVESCNIDIKEVEKKLERLNPSKSPGPDNIHPRILKELAAELSVGLPLQIIFETSIRTASVPTIWKEGQITAIYKNKGSKNDAGNYRPVSLTSVAGKTLEKFIANRLMDHMRTNNYLSDQQFGFISSRSTGLQLLKVMDDWTRALEQGHEVHTTYMDFMKAFDTVPHRRLLSKLKGYGVRANLLEWIRAFLDDRKQLVLVNGKASNWHKVTSGIPQGSVLGPVLFVLYINDLPEIIKSKCFMFADDTKVYRIILGLEDVALMQEDITSLQGWSDKWLLRFHPKKCKAMAIGKSKYEPEYVLNGEEESCKLEIISDEKDIGVYVDTKLNFRKHMQAMVNKANSRMAVISRTYTQISIKQYFLCYTMHW